MPDANEMGTILCGIHNKEVRDKIILNVRLST
jgi:hypothetical protein